MVHEHSLEHWGADFPVRRNFQFKPVVVTNEAEPSSGASVKIKAGRRRSLPRSATWFARGLASKSFCLQSAVMSLLISGPYALESVLSERATVFSFSLKR